MVALYFINSICAVLPSCEPFVTAAPPRSTARAPVTLGQAHQWPGPRWLPSPELVSRQPAATGLQAGLGSEWGPTDPGWGWGPGLLGLGSRRGLGRGVWVRGVNPASSEEPGLAPRRAPEPRLWPGAERVHRTGGPGWPSSAVQAELALEQLLRDCGAGVPEGGPGHRPGRAQVSLAAPAAPLPARPAGCVGPGPWASPLREEVYPQEQKAQEPGGCRAPPHLVQGCAGQSHAGRPAVCRPRLALGTQTVLALGPGPGAERGAGVRTQAVAGRWLDSGAVAGHREGTRGGAPSLGPAPRGSTANRAPPSGRCPSPGDSPVATSSDSPAPLRPSCSALQVRRPGSPSRGAGAEAGKG